ncbi:leucine-rich repeat-containing protein 34 [Eucyclogobius newberryi]|uniref:leucine-rich repeat-containing protein 34 n=1 Tax=Eucyclogobius newberryi TaxID=166745 RepID=UPI003B5CE5B2
MQARAEVYHRFCAENEIKTNPHVSDVLGKTPKTKKSVWKLCGNNKLNPFPRLDDEDALALSKCLLNTTDVTALDLSYNNITDKGVKHLAELLQGENSLRSLDLTFNDIGESGAQLLSQSLQSNTTLLSLTLSGNKVKNVGAMRLADLLQVNHALQELRLEHCDLDTQSVIAFAIVLKSNRTLLSLDISRPLLFGHQEEWAVHFSQMLAVNRSLQELHLGAMGIMSSGIERLSKALLFNHSLKYLNLRGNRVTRDDVLPLVDALVRKDSALEVLDLTANQVEDEGAEYLSGALASPNCSLKELSLSSNSIRTAGLLSLAKALDQNSTLTHIYIWGNHFEDPVCLAFRALMDKGRLHCDHTDVRAYEVDGRVFLAQVFQTLRRRFCKIPENDSSDDAGHEPKGIKFFV